MPSTELSANSISTTYFDQIIADLGPESAGAFAVLFFKDMRTTSAALLQAAGDKDWDKVKMHAHSIKSSALSFGLIQLSTRAGLVEDQCKENGRAEENALLDWPARLENDLAALNAKFGTLGIPPIS